MAIDYEDLQEIDRRIDRAISKRTQPAFAQGVVIKSDPVKNLVWLTEFGEQPIPLFTFDYNITYYDTKANSASLTDGSVSSSLHRKTAKIKPICPKKGDVVLVARQFGSRALPKCLGVLRSRGFEALPGVEVL